MLQYTDDPNFIVDTDTGMTIPRGSRFWPADESQIIAAPALTFAEAFTGFMQNCSGWMDDVVHANGYDSAASCASYTSSGITQFRNDAISFVEWRDALMVWMAGNQQGFNPKLPGAIPSWADVKAAAPQPEAYGWLVHPQGGTII